MLIAFQSPELSMTGFCPGAASKVIGALAVPLVVIFSVRGISTVHDLDGITGLHQVCGCLKAIQRSTRGCARVVRTTNFRAYIVSRHKFLSPLRALNSSPKILRQTPIVGA